MSRVADRMLEVMDQVDKMSKFNSQIFDEMKLLYGEESEEFKMIKEIDSKIDDLLTLLNVDDDEDEDLKSNHESSPTGFYPWYADEI